MLLHMKKRNSIFFFAFAISLVVVRYMIQSIFGTWFLMPKWAYIVRLSFFVEHASLTSGHTERARDGARGERKRVRHKCVESNIKKREKKISCTWLYNTLPLAKVWLYRLFFCRNRFVLFFHSSLCTGWSFFRLVVELLPKIHIKLHWKKCCFFPGYGPIEK